jgi:predicted DNA-binding transcriptional regulator YafY
VPHLPLLAHAVWDRKRISMRYESWTATMRRRCDPLGLVLKGGRWYLMARSRQRISIYKAAGIHELEVLDEAFERPAGFDLREQWARHVARFEKDLLTGQATLRVTHEGLRNLHHLGAAAAEQASCGFFDEDGWCEVTLPVEHTAQAAAQLLQLGPHVRVLEPAALRDALRELASRIAQLNAH